MKILQNSGFCETDDLVQAISWSELGGVVKIMSNILEKLTNIKISQLLKIIEIGYVSFNLSRLSSTWNIRIRAK